MVFGIPGYQEILIITILLGLVTVILTKILTDQNEIKRIKREMKFFQEKIKKAQSSGDKDAVSKLSNDMLKASGKQMKQSMKPMMVSLLVFGLAFWWMSITYEELLIALPISIPFFGSGLNWFWWYFVTILPINFLFRKMLGVE